MRKVGSQKPRKGAGVAKPAVRKAEQINLRVTAAQKDALQRLAGDDTISGYLLGRALGGAARHAFALQTIGELHAVGRQMQRLADHPASDAGQVAIVLQEVRQTIDRLAGAAIDEAEHDNGGQGQLA